MTVGELKERMSNQEFVEWSMYHARKAQKEEVASKLAKRGR